MCTAVTSPHLSHVLLDQLRADDSDEAGVGAVGHGASAQGFPGSRGSEQQHAFGRLDAQVHKALRLNEERQTVSEQEGDRK